MPIPPTLAADAGIGPTPPPRTWVQRRLLDPFLSLLKAGLSPARLALTVGVGVALGIGPLLGVTTVLSLVVALRLRLNVAAMQVVVHLLSPVQVLLLLPFLRCGAALLGHGDGVASLTLKQLQFMLKHDIGQVLRLLWRAELGALLLWAGLSVMLVGVLYVGLQPVFRKILREQVTDEAQGVVTEPVK